MSKLKFTAYATAFGLGVWGVTYATAPAYDGRVGITYGAAYAPARARDVDFHIWYPAEAGGRAVTVGGNGVFYGTPAGKAAPHRAGRFPMVLISHGSGARVDPAALQGFCDETDHGMSDCAFLARGGVDLHALDLSPAGGQDRAAIHAKLRDVIVDYLDQTNW